MNKSRSVPSSYIRTADYALHLEGVRFPPEVWAVFAFTEKPFSTEELAARLKLPLETVRSALRRLVRRKLVQKYELAWSSYLESAGPSPAGSLRVEIPAAPALEAGPRASALALPAAKPETNPVVSVAPVTISVRLAHPSLSEAKPELDVIRCTLGVETRGKRWKLRPLLDAIIQAGGTGMSGQSLVYRVFLRIPTALLASSGLSSPSAVDENFEVSDPRLIAALCKAARELASCDLEALAA